MNFNRSPITNTYYINCVFIQPTFLWHLFEKSDKVVHIVAFQQRPCIAMETGVALETVQNGLIQKSSVVALDAVDKYVRQLKDD